MIEVNKQVGITPSRNLAQMRLCGVIGRAGVVTEQVFGASSDLIGYMVLLEKSFQGEHLWFVPEDAVQYEKDSQ